MKTLELGHATTHQPDAIDEAAARDAWQTVEDRETSADKVESAARLFESLDAVYARRRVSVTGFDGDAMIGIDAIPTRTPDCSEIDELYMRSVYQLPSQPADETRTITLFHGDDRSTRIVLDSVAGKPFTLAVYDQDDRLLEGGDVDDALSDFTFRTNLAIGTYQRRSSDEQLGADLHARELLFQQYELSDSRNIRIEPYALRATQSD